MLSPSEILAGSFERFEVKNQFIILYGNALKFAREMISRPDQSDGAFFFAVYPSFSIAFTSLASSVLAGL